jgi:capsular polysaccharide biosynthesis protein
MARVVKVPFPLNIEEHNKYMFHNRLSYTVEPLKLKKLANVFVTFSGFCLGNKGLIKESHHHYKSQFQFYLRDAQQYLHNCSGQPENLLTPDDAFTYLTIHHPWFNYFHWMTESIFRLWIARRQINRSVLVLPEHYKNYDFITGSLEPFRIEKIYFIPDGKCLMVKKLFLPQIKPLCDSYNAFHLKQVSAFYKNYVLNEKKIPSGSSGRVYVSRKLARSRKVVNEDKIIPVLEKYGFAVFYPEHYSFLEQVAFFAGIRYLVGTHGSGLTNLMFMEKNTSLLELHKNKTNELSYPSPLFWYMANALGINYYQQLCFTQGPEDYYRGDYVVDQVLLEQNIILMLSDA